LLHLLEIHGLARDIEFSDALTSNANVKDLWQAHQAYDKFKAQAVKFLSLASTLSISGTALQGDVNNRLNSLKWATLNDKVLFKVDIFLNYQ
jgi:hypothetical protein